MKSPMFQKSKLFVRVVAGFALLFATAFGRADDTNHEPDDQMALNRLAAIWQGNLSEIKSANIRYRSLARGPSKPAAREVVLELLEKLDFVNRPDDARLLSRDLGLGILPEQALWGNGDLYLIDNKIRTNRDYGGRRISESVAVDAVHIVASRLNAQIAIYARDGRKRDLKPLDDLRVIPRLEQQAVAKIEKRSADGLVVKIGAKQFIVDEGTGFVRSVSWELNGSAEDIFQKGLVVYPGGISFPAAIITCRYVKGNLQFIQVDVIESATFNEPIKDEEFAVNAPPGSKVFDHRMDRDQPGFFTQINEPAADVLSEIAKILAGLK